ncbi:MAG: hypothetical protein LBK44_02845 [Spirochaetales bacterium]|jgi:hypothetical protein|nr:hypothetical protein [Spirochaetales bacterium]
MNTTPGTFKPSPPRPAPPSYTVVGGPGSPGRDGGGFSLILLNRGGTMSRSDALEDFEKLRPDEIISLENPGGALLMESLAARFPRVRFILFHQAVTPGERINIAMREARLPLAAVLWSDMKALPSGFPEGALRDVLGSGVLCTTPWFYSRENESMPVLQIPAFQKKKLKVLSVLPAREISSTLFPYDYCGIYSREKFLSIGGYDPGIHSPWWQKADLGLRALLWGEKIVSSRLLRVTASETAPAEDTGADRGYRMFFLKNLAVRLGPQGGRLSRASFFPFFLHSGCGLPAALAEFRLCRRWVSENAPRFQKDALSVISQWETPSE